MNLRQIEAFKAVIESGTVTQAAVRLHISQPAVSKLLQMFERSTGIDLFVRNGRALTPTPEARLLYEQVDRVFQGAELVRQAANEIKSLQRGSLAVGVMPGLSIGFAQDVLAHFQASHPDVQTFLHAREMPQLVHHLATHQIELLYSTQLMTQPELAVEAIARIPLVCILPRGHRLESKTEISCEDLRDERFASFRPESAIRQRIDQTFAKAKVRRVLALDAPTAPCVCAFVARGLGVSIVSPLYIGSLFAPALAVRPFAPEISTDLYMARPRSRRISQLAESFADASRAYARLLESNPIAFA